ncbi:MAG: hypothetical protein RIS24_3471, partial [Verrucomicrobiota bacterium]
MRFSGVSLESFLWFSKLGALHGFLPILQPFIHRLSWDSSANASEVDIAKIQAELEPVLVPGETIGRGFKVFRDLFIFTDHRLILIDRQGITGS